MTVGAVERSARRTRRLGPGTSPCTAGRGIGGPGRRTPSAGSTPRMTARALRMMRVRSSPRCSVSVITASGVRSGFGVLPRRRGLMRCGLLPRWEPAQVSLVADGRVDRVGDVGDVGHRVDRLDRVGDRDRLGRHVLHRRLDGVRRRGSSSGSANRRALRKLRRRVGRRVVRGLVAVLVPVMTGNRAADFTADAVFLTSRAGSSNPLRTSSWNPLLSFLISAKVLPARRMASGSFSGPSTTRARRRMTTISLPDRLNTRPSLKDELSRRPARAPPEDVIGWHDRCRGATTPAVAARDADPVRAPWRQGARP